jgi:DNA-binding MarR family transcriptional regulator
MKLAELIKQDRFASAAQEAMFNVMVTSSWLFGEMAGAMAPYDVTPAQYNVLRILRGSHPTTLTCSAIGERLLDRTPDVTRLLNRLEQRDLIRRERAGYDRRVVEVAITRKGLDLLARMQDDVQAATARLTGHLSDDEHRLLSDLLERLRTDQ